MGTRLEGDKATRERGSGASTLKQKRGESEALDVRGQHRPLQTQKSNRKSLDSLRSLGMTKRELIR